jgi:hypothetical protein
MIATEKRRIEATHTSRTFVNHQDTLHHNPKDWDHTLNDNEMLFR